MFKLCKYMIIFLILNIGNVFAEDVTKGSLPEWLKDYIEEDRDVIVVEVSYLGSDIIPVKEMVFDSKDLLVNEYLFRLFRAKPQIKQIVFMGDPINYAYYYDRNKLNLQKGNAYLFWCRIDSDQPGTLQAFDYCLSTAARKKEVLSLMHKASIMEIINLIFLLLFIGLFIVEGLLLDIRTTDFNKARRRSLYVIVLVFCAFLAYDAYERTLSPIYDIRLDMFFILPVIIIHLLFLIRALFRLGCLSQRDDKKL